MRRAFAAAAVLAAAQTAAAQEGTAVSIAESEEYGQYLTVADKPVYLFTADRQGAPDAGPGIACLEECLDAWPLVTTDGVPVAGEGARPDLLGTTEHEGRTVVTYGGWPLYTFARDSEGNAPTGQEIESFGGEWYLIGPDGQRIEGEGV